MKKPLRKQTQATVKQFTNLLAFSMSLKHLHVLQFLTSQKLLLWPNLTHSLKKEQKEKWGWKIDVLLKTICLLSRWPKRRNRFTMLRSTEQNINVSLSCRARYRSRTGSHGEVKWIRRSCRLFNYCWVEKSASAESCRESSLYKYRRKNRGSITIYCCMSDEECF